MLDGFPDTFPPPPAQARTVSTEVAEQALLSGDFSQEHGTVVHRTVHYGYTSGDQTEAEQLLDHYRTALSAAGWTITADELLDPDKDPDVNSPATGCRSTATSTPT